ncbi:MAG: FAD:protein FMN transferase [Burkholderiales bacterium]
MNTRSAGRWLRRAQPLLGTLVEVGVFDAGADPNDAIDAAFAAIRDAQRCLSRFDVHSDIARFNALRRGERLALRPISQHVLAAADALRGASAGAFDISLGSGRDDWALRAAELHKLGDAVRLDLGGIGKGHAVDLGVDALVAHGVSAGWVNAGGDLRTFGDVDTPLQLRDEASGGVRTFASLRDGAFATSHFGADSRSWLSVGPRAPALSGAHVSVAAPLCLWADALTKVVALSGDTSHPLVTRYDAVAWVH